MNALIANPPERLNKTVCTFLVFFGPALITAFWLCYFIFMEFPPADRGRVTADLFAGLAGNAAPWLLLALVFFNGGHFVKTLWNDRPGVWSCNLSLLPILFPLITVIFMMLATPPEFDAWTPVSRAATVSFAALAGAAVTAAFWKPLRFAGALRNAAVRRRREEERAARETERAAIDAANLAAERGKAKEAELDRAMNRAAAEIAARYALPSSDAAGLAAAPPEASDIAALAVFSHRKRRSAEADAEGWRRRAESERKRTEKAEAEAAYWRRKVGSAAAGARSGGFINGMAWSAAASAWVSAGRR